MIHSRLCVFEGHSVFVTSCCEGKFCSSSRTCLPERRSTVSHFLSFCVTTETKILVSPFFFIHPKLHIITESKLPILLITRFICLYPAKCVCSFIFFFLSILLVSCSNKPFAIIFSLHSRFSQREKGNKRSALDSFLYFADS